MSDPSEIKSESTTRLGRMKRSEMRAQLVQIAEFEAAEDHHVSDMAALLVDLLTIADQAEQAENNTVFTDQIQNECAASFEFLFEQLNHSTGNSPELANEVLRLQETWGDYLELLEPTERFSPAGSDTWESGSPTDWNIDVSSDMDETEHDGDFSASIAEVSKLLSEIDQLPREKPPQSAATPDKPDEQQKDFSKLIVDSIDDPELISAYVDDAQQCLSGMETCLLELESNKNAVESLRQFCRELHTLKGASGTVGLMRLADYLHELETDVEKMSQGGKKVDIDPLLKGVDFVRQQLTQLAPQVIDDSPVPVAKQASQATVSTKPLFPQQTETPTRDAVSETYVRLEASRLDRLMDLLAELVMLRNRRETYVTSLENLYHEINSCSTRLRLIDTYQDHSSAEQISPTGTDREAYSRQHLLEKNLTNKITELSKDVGELGDALSEVVDPLSRDNSSISHLIGNFRSELMELRRQPITGLFRRLHRVARDAGRAENRQIELNLIGQGTRVERALQDRLYEPLMHLIRNSVSHGIESAEEREQAGKPPVGQVTLEAWSDATSIYLEIRDDGRGLNVDTLERRGLELGLLRPGVKYSQEKLWELILRPGFSTKTEVSQISGRGVGMDVVASQVRSMRGKVAIDSQFGRFTSFRLEIPLSSTIEHAMVVRCSDQLFALPMHAILGTQTDEQVEDHQKVIGLHELLHLPSSHSTSQRVISLRPNEMGVRDGTVVPHDSETLSIVVDTVVGVEEVVIRSLPALLQNHSCFSGVTLSGEAETVLVLDVPRLSEYAHDVLSNNGEELIPDPPSSSLDESPASKRGLNFQSKSILVVDDSISVRRNFIRKLAAHGFDVVEATDGIQALERVKDSRFVAVISDIDMPRMNGVDFVSELRRSEKFQDLPVVVVTSRRDESVIQAMKDLGVRRIFTKPVNDAMMKSLLHSIRFKSNTFDTISSNSS